jgi:hypothetical protein
MRMAMFGCVRARGESELHMLWCDSFGFVSGSVGHGRTFNLCRSERNKLGVLSCMCMLQAALDIQTPWTLFHLAVFVQNEGMTETLNERPKIRAILVYRRDE